MLLYIIRHGDPIYNPDSLTPKGHLQAAAVAKRLAVHGIDKIYSSPLIRAQQTAQPTCDLLGKEMQIEEWASENLAYKNMSVEMNEKDKRVRHWVFHQQLTNIYNDETANLNNDNWHTAEVFTKYSNDFKGCVQRIADASDEFLARHGYKREGAVYKITEPNDQRIAMFCHQGFGVTWLSHLLGVPPHIFWTSFDLTHSSITIINFKNYENNITKPICLALSDTSHLYKEGLPLKFNNTLDI